MKIYDETQINDAYQSWLENAKEEAMHKELIAIAGDKNAISERFYTDLAFGTGGMRGIMGAGRNRMNIYTVLRATWGLCEYLLNEAGDGDNSVAIAYDSRINSRQFAFLSARLIASFGIKAFIYPRLEPTPALSFAVRYLKCDAGIVITASHNPSEYNGFKVYGSDGGQLTDAAADRIQFYIDRTDYFIPANKALKTAENNEHIELIADEVLNEFTKQALSFRVDSTQRATNLRIVYTPLNGAGLECAKKALELIGAQNYSVVASQQEPDGNFPTCPYPNPEMKEALREGLAECEQKNADLLIATDPDSDRLAVAVKNDGEYKLINGNELGLLLTDYILSGKAENTVCPTVITTIVSSMMVDDIAQSYNANVVRTLTGFKYIGEVITKMEQQGMESGFLFGFEESCGYLVGAHVRDKDAIGTLAMVCDLAEKLKASKTDLYEKMQLLYKKYGYKMTLLKSFGFTGEEGMVKMSRAMDSLRQAPPATLGNSKVESIIDYKNGYGELPPSDVIELKLQNGSKAIIRPSGTEPKIKTYLFASAQSKEESENMLSELAEAVGGLLNL